jgi:cell division protein FtsZ
MSASSSSLLLIGIGGAGCAIARGVNRAFGDGLRYVLTDTDAKSGEAGGPFTLLGGDRLSGRGAGGDLVAARLAAEDSIRSLDDSLEGVRLAILVTSLGGGTGGGATLEAVKHLSALGIPSCVFATTPFAFEGENRQRNARGVQPMIAETANASFFIPLDKLVGDADRMDEALCRAVDTLASGITLFWRLVEKPGYIRLDAERIRHLISGSGRGRFATVTVQGPNRAADAVDALFDPYQDFLPFGKPEIVTCKFGNEANLIGALAFHLGARA